MSNRRSFPGWFEGYKNNIKHLEQSSLCLVTAAVIVFSVIAGIVLFVLLIVNRSSEAPVPPVPPLSLPLTLPRFVLISLISTLFQRFSGKCVKMQIWGPHLGSAGSAGWSWGLGIGVPDRRPGRQHLQRLRVPSRLWS